MKKIFIVTLLLFLLAPMVSEAHRSGCHRWHSCPSDSGSYTCGDAGHPCAYPTYPASGGVVYPPSGAYKDCYDCPWKTVSSNDTRLWKTQMSKGTSGAGVSILQQALKQDGSYTGDVTGYYGVQTESAVKFFQSKNNIINYGSPATTGYGSVGWSTLKKLNEQFSGQTFQASEVVQSAPTVSVPSPTNAANTNNALVIPENAKLNYFKDGWECSRGYYKTGNSCSQVILPANAKLNYFGDSWECERGFYKTGTSCSQVLIPANAKLNYFGDGWDCNRGYFKTGNSCSQVIIPINGKLNYFGDGWECERGYHKVGNSCSEVVIPVNGKLNYFGDDWECRDGYTKQGDSCL